MRIFLFFYIFSFFSIVIQYIINQNIMTLKEIYKKEKGMTILNITTVPVGIL